MANKELLELERLLTKYHIETESVAALEKIRPCLFMVKEILALIGGGYASKNYDIDLATLADQQEESKYQQ